MMSTSNYQYYSPALAYFSPTSTHHQPSLPSLYRHYSPHGLYSRIFLEFELDITLAAKLWDLEGTTAQTKSMYNTPSSPCTSLDLESRLLAECAQPQSEVPPHEVPPLDVAHDVAATGHELAAPACEDATPMET